MGVWGQDRRAPASAVAALWAVISCTAMLGCCIQVARAAPLETYGRLPSLENVVLSPDGLRLAFLTSSHA
jgi:hypothetical protein